MTGVILRLRFDKGFGFIRGEDKHEYFFHRSHCREGSPFEMLRENDPVSFVPELHQKGERATKVEVAL